jgi:hypothetical protein
MLPFLQRHGRLAAILLAACWLTMCAIQAAGTLHTDPLWLMGFAPVGAALATYGLSISIGGISIQKSVNREGEHPNPYIFTLAAATAGTLTTRTGDDAGVITLGDGHGLTSGTYDVYWTTTGVNYVQYACTGVIDANTLTIADGTGDNLPSGTTPPVVVCKQAELSVTIYGNDVQLASISLEYVAATNVSAGHIDFQNDTPETVTELDLVGNTPRVWDVAGGAQNVFADDDPVVMAYASHASTTEAATLKIATIENRS